MPYPGDGRFGQRCGAGTGPAPARARFQTDQDDLGRRHTDDEDRERRHLEGPVLDRQEEDRHGDDGSDVGVHRLGLRVCPALHHRGDSGQEVGGDGRRDGDDAVTGHEPRDRADDRHHAACVVDPADPPHRVGIVERGGEDQQRHEAHHEGGQGAQAHALLEFHGGSQQRRDGPEEPRHPVRLRGAPQGVSQVYGRAQRTDCGPEENPIDIDHRATVCCAPSLPSCSRGDTSRGPRASNFVTQGRPEGAAPVQPDRQQSDLHG